MTERILVVSSGNKGKIKEIKAILNEIPLKILSKDEIGLENVDVIEDRDTLEENSTKKAVEIHSFLKDVIVIADDSGLFVDHLNGEPGIYSARYAGVDGDDEANNKKLLEQLKEVPEVNRIAKFKTAIAIALEDGTVETVVGECSGKIITEKRGVNGFGYDPLFIPDGYEKTFAELDQDIKNKISHRSDALEKLKIKLKELI